MQTAVEQGPRAWHAAVHYGFHFLFGTPGKRRGQLLQRGALGNKFFSQEQRNDPLNSTIIEALPDVLARALHAFSRLKRSIDVVLPSN